MDNNNQNKEFRSHKLKWRLKETFKSISYFCKNLVHLMTVMHLISRKKKVGEGGPADYKLHVWLHYLYHLER